MKKRKDLITFQEIIKRLDKFWGSKGCLIAQPYGLEVGAGTSNPNTFLRSLGPEPFNVAYVEPSRRPDDGRYGQNPYRLQHYFQYQIILKPAPENNQELYMQSLEALGIDTAKHDIRFVEDNWESPAIGAWGLGWEVWLDGMEITQYTYFQQVAGISLEVPVLEITLGLERLAMYIQGVDDYRDIMFNEDVTYGQLFEQHEYWQSKHNYETADIKDLENIYSLMRDQVFKQVDYGNYWAAYDYLLKISHIFNVLDSRGVISVTDRISRFDVMGKLANRIGDLYLKEREELDYPMSKVAETVKYSLSKERLSKSQKEKREDKLVSEFYFEEFPADFIREWRENYLDSDGVAKWLEDYGLKFKDVKLYWSSRRLVLVIEGCGNRGNLQKEVYGPMYDIAYTDGKLNKVGKGFLKKHGAKEKDIVKIERGGNTLLGISMNEKIGLDVILHGVMEKLVSISPQGKKMRWLENQKFGFIRPLRNIVCFRDGKKINVSFWDIKSSNYVFCARSYPKDVVVISSAQQYLDVVKKKGIILDESYREGLIREVVDSGREKYEYSENTENLITINSFLAEFPNLKFFTLDEKYAQLPIELIKKVLEDNQKYIIRVLKEDPSHVEYGIVANKQGDASDIFKGNRKVVQGRLDDALFYWERDVGVKLGDLRKNLKDIVFHPKAGSYKEKVARIDKLAKKVLKQYDLDVNLQILDEILSLIKNDKATSMVQEFASLEGIVGMYYAGREGYAEEVVRALYEHYLPTSEGSDLPSSNEGVLLSFVDKLDNVLTFSEIGGLPQGSNDPFEIRKNVYGLIRILRESSLNLDLYSLIDSDEVIDFFNQRIYQLMKAESNIERLAKGIAYSENGNVAQKFEYFEQMCDLVKNKEIEDKVFDTLKRVYNILDKEGVSSKDVDEQLLETDSEKKLYSFVSTFNQKKMGVKDLLELADLLEDFFKETMVNVDNELVKANRIALLSNLKNVLKMILVM